MKIKLTSVHVDDHEKALRFYTEVLGFVEEGRLRVRGRFRSLTVVSPEDPDGTELQLALNDSRAGEGLPAGGVPARPTRGDVLHRQHAGRLRAHESARGRVHDAAHGCDRLEDRQAERHLRQFHSGHATGALVGGPNELEHMDSADPSLAVHCLYGDFIANFIALAQGGGMPPPWVTYSPLLPLAVASVQRSVSVRAAVCRQMAQRRTRAARHGLYRNALTAFLGLRRNALTQRQQRRLHGIFLHGVGRRASRGTGPRMTGGQSYGVFMSSPDWAENVPKGSTRWIDGLGQSRLGEPRRTMSDDTELAAGLYERLITSNSEGPPRTAGLRPHLGPDATSRPGRGTRNVRAAHRIRGCTSAQRLKRKGPPGAPNRKSSMASSRFCERTRKRWRSLLRNCSLCSP